MKKILSLITICLLCLSMFPIFSQKAHAEPASAYLTDFVQLTTNPYDDRGAGWSPDSSKITYSAFADSWYRHIWVMNRDGSGKRQLTFGDVVDDDPDYSPDGTKIVFVRYGLRGWGLHDIFIMNEDGTGTAQRITSTGLARLNVRWSNDGQRLAFYYGGAGTNTNEIHIMNIDGTNEVAVASGTYAVMNPYWSPDDTKLVYTMDDGIWIVDTSPPYQKTRVFQTSLLTTYAVFSPDGNYIMYASGVYGQLQDLYLIDVSGNFIAQLTYDTKFGYLFDWSPDGQYIAFDSINSDNYDIWRAKIVITGLTILAVNVFDESGFPPASVLGANRLADIPIKIYTLEGTLVASGLSDLSGTASFCLAEGEYKIVYGSRASGRFGVASKTVDVSGVSLSIDLYCFQVTYHIYEEGGPYELNYIDLDTSSGGYQGTITVQPGQQINAEFSWWELETVNVPVWLVSAFGSWNPTSALGNLASGCASPYSHNLYTIPLTFTAPTTPGTYEVRLVGVLDYDWPNSFYTAAHYQPSLGRDTGITIISKALDGPYGIGTIIVGGQQPDFEISISPNQITASPRFEDSFIVTIHSLNGFNSPVSLSGPEGPEISVTFADETITPPSGGSAWTTASISVLSTLPKTHTIPIGGTSGTVSHSAGIELTVPFMSVPYLSQGFTEWCGPTSIAMIVRYFGKDVHQWDVAKGLSLGHDLGSIELGFLLIKTYIVGLGLGYEYQGPPVSTLTKDVLVRMLDDGKPILANLNLPLGGHYVVLTGYKEDSQEFYVHDPSGALIAYTSSWSSYNSMPFSHIPVSWGDLQPYLKFAIGVQGNPEPLIGALNLIGGDKTYDRTVSASHSSYSPWSDDVYIWWSGADSPTTDGLSWKASNGHSQNLDPDDYLAVYGVPPPPPDTKLIHPLIVNPTDKSQDFQFEISFIKDGTQKWTSGKIDILDVPACSMANTPYSRTSPIRIGDILNEYGEYTISLKLFDSEGVLLDQIGLPKIKHSSILKVSMHSPANLLITDSLGRSIGVDPTSGQVVNQIPDATYLNTTESQIIMVPDPINGSYNIQVHGTGKGSYTLTTELVTYIGTAAKTYSGQISLDEIQTFVASISGTELALNSPSPTYLWIYIVLTGAFVAAAIVVFFAVRKSKKKQSNSLHPTKETT